MLAWFKKKFGKKPVEPEAVQPEESLEAVAVDAPEELVAAQSQEVETSAIADTVPEIVPEPLAEPREPESEAVADEVFAEGQAAEAVEDVPHPEPVLEFEPAASIAEVVAAETVVEEEVLAAEEPAPPVAEIELTPPAPPEETPQVAAQESAIADATEAVEDAETFEAEPSETAAAVEVVADVQEIGVPAEEEEAPSEPLAAEVGAQSVEDIVEEAVAEEAEATEDAAALTEAAIDEEAVTDLMPAAPLAEKTQEKPASKSLFGRLRERLGKTRDAFIYRLDRLFLGKKEIDQDLFEQLEEVLITADLGVSTTLDLLDRARKKVKRDQLSDPQALKGIIRDEILGYIQASERPAELVMPEEGPFVIMVVGVNGVGKTTSIGKIAAKFVRSGQSVLLVAGDTFRAAAINQLRIWGERVGVEVIAQKPGADPSSVVFDGLEYGAAHNYDVILIDTAGRLHTSVNLMEELKKIRRVIAKKLPGAPHEVMLVLDATTGQNGISQAKMFHEAVGVSGLTLTKLDGTAKGGIVANVCRETGIPVRFIGIGEQIDDLRDFDAREFVDALFASSEH